MECAPATYFATPRYPLPTSLATMLTSPAEADYVALMRLRGGAVERGPRVCASVQAMWAQCGGKGYPLESNGCCVSNAACVPMSEGFSMCVPK
eukprot:1343211-Pyramimonas_sp.AAC.1